MARIHTDIKEVKELLKIWEKAKEKHECGYVELDENEIMELINEWIEYLKDKGYKYFIIQKYEENNTLNKDINIRVLIEINSNNNLFEQRFIYNGKMLFDAFTITVYRVIDNTEMNYGVETFIYEPPKE